MVISGLPAGIASGRREAGGWSRRRAVRIAVPLITGVVVTGPLIAALGHAGSLNGQETPSPFAVHHLWFLLALLIYLPILPLLDALDRRFAVIGRLERGGLGVRRLQLLVLAPTAALSAVLMGGAAFASHRWGPFTTEAADLVNNIPTYAPMFFLGALLGRAAKLRAALVSDVSAPVAALAVTLLVELAASWTGIGAVGGTGAIAILVLGLSTCPVLVAVLVLRSATGIHSVDPFVRRLSDAAMTMYIVHFPILAVLNAALGRVSWNVHLEYALAVLVAGALSYGFHQHAVRRAPILRALFNGHFPPRRTGRDARPPYALAKFE